MKSKEQKLEHLDKVIDDIFDEMKELFKQLVFRYMTYRDISMDIISDKLQESFDQMSPELKEKLKWEELKH